MDTFYPSKNPDFIVAGDKDYDDATPDAYRFSLLNGKVVSTKGTRAAIFTALTVMANPDGTAGANRQMPRASIRRDGTGRTCS